MIRAMTPSVAEVSHLPFKEIRRTDEHNYAIATPSILKTAESTYLVCCDGYGSGVAAAPNAPSWIDRTTDGGATWTQRAAIAGAFWSTLFYPTPSAYPHFIGMTGENGAVVCGYTTDNGATWTKAVIKTGNYTSSACKPFIKNGRIYKVVERINTGTGRPVAFFVMHAAVGADLTLSASWTSSGEHVHVPEDGGLEWLEGHALELADDVGTDNISLLFRLMYGGNNIGMAKFNTATGVISLDYTRTATPLEPTAWHACPFSWCKWDQIQCPVTKLFIVVGNDRDVHPFPGPGGEDRTIGCLYVTKDFSPGSYKKVHTFFDLGGENYLIKGIQYPSMIRDGNKLVIVWRDASDGADDYHDANRITFDIVDDYLAILSNFVLPKI